MKQVLIVEDQRMPRKYMERMISDSEEYALAASISGADVALAYCGRQMIDLILTIQETGIPVRSVMVLE